MRINLNCPFSEKDQVKALGAKWDPERKTWYVIDPLDLKKFARWLPLMSRLSQDMLPKQKNHHKPKTTGTYRPYCACNVLPWEDCEHTEMEAQKESANILGIDGFVF